MMRKIWKYPRDVIQCVRLSYCSDNIFIIYIFSQKKFHLSVITREHLTFLADSDTDSENVSLVRRSVSDGQKPCSSKGVSLMGI